MERFASVARRVWIPEQPLGSAVTGASTPYMSGVVGSHARGMSDTATKWRQRVAGWRASGDHSAIGYITPADFLAARGPTIWAERDRRLEAARELRRIRRAERHPEAAA
jgi:hypothetical protein